ncbi:ATPase AAA [Clostridium aceticum]|uniref:IS21-like element helper ATPase IstB n=1 Tax=Clostridium aceticum TaxID=84022 RepID=UPI0005CF0D01|nr:IS21-like element helper ATPase IstB [Clostridium aceticum]KJF25389.1 ATPase AAA [Clostridium aceticum]
MVNETTISKLHEMRLTAMADSFREQLQSSSFQELNFEERFGLMVDIEWSRRKSNKLIKLIKKADFRYSNACVEDIEYHSDRKLDKGQIARLATCNYIQEKHNIIILGASGNGKSYIGCALGVAACRNYYTVKYVRLPDLLDELTIARGEGIFKKVMKQYKSVSLLILDEWLLVPLKGVEARDLLEIIEARHQNGSTIFCSQFAPGGWHEKIGEDTLADAILDRICHDSYTIHIDGKVSMRERNGLQQDK